MTSWLDVKPTGLTPRLVLLQRCAASQQPAIHLLRYEALKSLRHAYDTSGFQWQCLTCTIPPHCRQLSLSAHKCTDLATAAWLGVSWIWNVQGLIVSTPSATLECCRGQVSLVCSSQMLVNFIERDGLARMVLLVLLITTISCFSYTWGYYEASICL